MDQSKSKTDRENTEPSLINPDVDTGILTCAKLREDNAGLKCAISEADGTESDHAGLRVGEAEPEWTWSTTGIDMPVREQLNVENNGSRHVKLLETIDNTKSV